MSNSKKITREAISQTAWGAPYLREMDLIIASNELASARLGKTAYNSDFDLLAADRLMPLDGGYQEKRYDTVIIPQDDQAPWRRIPSALEFLKALPRGHWAVFELDGGYDAYMADGHGGTGTQSGHKFTKNSAAAPAFNTTELYSHVISGITYLRRNEIRNKIAEHSFAISGITKGSVFKDMRIDGKEFSKVEVDEVLKDYYSGGSDAVRVKATRRGVKPTHFIISTASFGQRAGVDFVMPPEFEDADNADRLISYLRDPEAEPSSAMRL